MYCRNCGALVEDGVKFCTECGEKIIYPTSPMPAPEPVIEPAAEPVIEQVYQPAEEPEAPVYETPAYEAPVYEAPAAEWGARESFEPEAEPMPVQKPAAPKAKKTIPGGKKAIVLIAAAAVLIIAAVLLLVNSKPAAVPAGAVTSSDQAEAYADAVVLMESGDYDKAIAAFAALNGYKDSAARMEKCENAKKDEAYAAATALMDGGDYEAAVTAFEALAGYKDSAAKAEACRLKVKPEAAVLEGFDELNAGDVITFGRFEQDGDESNGPEDIEWMVLDKEGTRALVLSVKGLACVAYNTETTAVTWENSSLRAWLNGEFAEKAFTAEELANIPTVTVPAGRNTSYSVDPGPDTEDKIFALSMEEVKQYFANDNARMCSPAKGAITAEHVSIYAYMGAGYCPWWLRTPGESPRDAVSVANNGTIRTYGESVSNSYVCARPAMWIDFGG